MKFVLNRMLILLLKKVHKIVKDRLLCPPGPPSPPFKSIFTFFLDYKTFQFDNKDRKIGTRQNRIRGNFYLRHARSDELDRKSQRDIDMMLRVKKERYFEKMDRQFYKLRSRHTKKDIENLARRLSLRT